MQCKVMFHGKFCIIQNKKTDGVIGIMKGEHGLYYLLNESIETSLRRIKEEAVKISESLNGNYREKKAMNAVNQVPSLVEKVPKLSKESIWHHRLGHAPMNRVAMIKEIEVKKDCNDICLTCPLAKFTKIPFTQSDARASDLFEMVHIDTWGPYKVSYKGKFRYFLTLVDDHSRVTWVHLLKLKSDAFDAIQNFVRMASTQFGKQVKIIRSDNALEFDDSKCRPFFEQLGIIHQTSCADTPQ